MTVELILDEHGDLWIDPPNHPYVKLDIKAIPQDLLDQLFDENELSSDSRLDYEAE